MIDCAPVFAPNRRDVAHETFDDEVILIHFPSGKYFRLDASGRRAWAAIGDGATAADIATTFRDTFEVGEAEARASAEALLVELREYGLVVEAPTPRPRALPVPAPPSARAPFHAPRLEVFTDLEALFLVDPIHDVDAAGWPHAKP